MKKVRQDDESAIDTRIEQFIELGFSKEEADNLARNARKVKRPGVSEKRYWMVAEVQAMIDHKDCDHRLAVELICPDQPEDYK